MKKIFLSLMIIVISSGAHAFVYHDNQLPDKLIYCPEKIECAENDSIGSCKISGEHLEYWDVQKLRILPRSKVRKGTYTISMIHSYFQYVENAPTQCDYKIYDAAGKKHLLRVSALFPILEPIYDKKYSWIDNKYANDGLEHNGYCLDDHVNQCPFQERASVLFLNSSTKNELVTISVNDLNIVSEGFGRVDISYKKIISICGGVKECKIDIVVKDPLHINDKGGGVYVDMSRRMKITHSVSSSPDILEKIQPFNMILVR